MSSEDQPANAKVPKFDNLADECKFWKESSLKWKQKYQNAIRLYYEALWKLKVTPLDNTYPTFMRKKAKDSKVKDPLRKKTFGVKTRQLIIQHFDIRDLLKMTEVCSFWKNFIEKSDLLSDVKLVADLTRDTRTGAVGDELMHSERPYSEMYLTYDRCNQFKGFHLLRKFSQSLEELKISEKIDLNEIDYMSTNFPKLRILQFETYMTDEVCCLLSTCEFESLSCLKIKRIGHCESLLDFIFELKSLRELHIAADHFFYRDFDCKSVELTRRLKKLHIDIIDSAEVIPVYIFTPFRNSVTSITLSGVCKFSNVTQALQIFPHLKELTIDFGIESDKEFDGVICATDYFDEELEPHGRLWSLLIRDIDIIGVENFKKLLLYTPQIRELEIHSLVTEEIFEAISSSLCLLKQLVCPNFEQETFDFQQRVNSNRYFNTQFNVIVE